MYLISNGGQTTSSYGLTLHVKNTILTAAVRTKSGTVVTARDESYTLSNFQVIVQLLIAKQLLKGILAGTFNKILKYLV